MKIFFTLTPKNLLFGRTVRKLGYRISPSKVLKFPDGERCFEPLIPVKDHDVFLFCSFAEKVNDNLLSLLMAIDVVKKNQAKSITLILPYICYSRQDRRFFEFSSVNFRFIADLLCFAGANKVLVSDLHSLQTQGFFNVIVHHVPTTVYVAKKVFSQVSKKDLVFISPDRGGSKRTRDFADFFGMDCFVLEKTKTRKGIDFEGVTSDQVKDKNCFIVDDILGSGETMIQAMKFLKNLGASAFYIYITHAIFCADALERFRNLHEDGWIVKFFVSDSVEQDFSDYPFIQVISLDELYMHHLKYFCE